MPWHVIQTSMFSMQGLWVPGVQLAYVCFAPTHPHPTHNPTAADLMVSCRATWMRLAFLRGRAARPPVLTWTRSPTAWTSGRRCRAGTWSRWGAGEGWGGAHWAWQGIDICKAGDVSACLSSSLLVLLLPPVLRGWLRGLMAGK